MIPIYSQKTQHYRENKVCLVVKTKKDQTTKHTKNTKE